MGLESHSHYVLFILSLARVKCAIITTSLRILRIHKFFRYNDTNISCINGL